MGDYRKIAVRRFPRLALRETTDSRYWKSFQFPVVIKEFASVTSIAISPVRPFDIAACTSTKVQIYSSSSNKLTKSISRFKGIVHGCSFRHDGALLLAGDETGLVQMFDVNGRDILRSFAGHTRGVHVSKFLPDTSLIFSGGDDATVRTWDVPTQQQVMLFADHKDHVRSGVASPNSPHLFLTGSYDHTVRLWDTRTQACAASVDHGFPVEAVLMFPSGSAFLSAGGNTIKLWDALTGRLLHAFSNHQKTVTALCFDGQNKRLLAGGLDHQLKIFDVASLKVVHSIKYSAPILSVAVSPNDTHLVVGMAGGLLSIKHRETAAPAAAAVHVHRPPRPASFRYFVRGQDHKAAPGDVVVQAGRKPYLSEYDKLLRKFRYGEALDAVLKNSRPAVVYSLLQELVLRSALTSALRGRDDRGLAPVLQFVAKHISNPRYSSLLIDVAHTILDLYAPGLGQSQAIDETFVLLSRRLATELKFQSQLMELLGAMDLVLASGARGKSAVPPSAVTTTTTAAAATLPASAPSSSSSAASAADGTGAPAAVMET